VRKQRFPHLVGSKWTACDRTFGWQHFRVINRKQEGKILFAELVAACDPTVRFWLNAAILKDRRTWQPGWQSLAEQKSTLDSPSTREF
jgi:tryptophan-rich hypothetical protein